MGFLDTLQWAASPLRGKVEALEKRWKALYAWGVKEKLPAYHWRWDDYEIFRAAIEKEKDPEYIKEILPHEIEGLNDVEHVAKTSGGYDAPEPLEPPDEDDQPAAANAHYSTGTPEKALENFQKFVDSLDISKVLPKLPWFKIGIGVSVTLVAVGLVGAFAARSAAPVVVPLATGGAVRLRGDEGEREKSR